MKLSPYLIFNGRAEEAAAFYADVFGGRIENLHRYADFPPMPGCEVAEESRQLVGHCCIVFEGGSLSVADSLPSDPRTFGCGNMNTLCCDSAEQAEAIFAGLEAGSIGVLCPMGEAFFAKRYGEVADRFGVLWAVMFNEA
jgi:PhnB protein